MLNENNPQGRFNRPQQHQQQTDNVIQRNQGNQDEFDKLVRHLQDPEIYVLNDLRDQLDNETDQGLPGEWGPVQDQTSIAIMNHLPSEIPDVMRAEQEADSLFQDSRIFGRKMVPGSA